MFVAKMDELGRPAWLALTVLTFWFWWPLGLAMLAFLAGSGRLRFGGACGAGTWFNLRQDGRGNRWSVGPNSGNRAFDEYRAETLRRLEEEQREFQAYLERLRKARDKEEFDSFMADRRRRADEEPVNT